MAPGFLPQRVEITVGADAVTADVASIRNCTSTEVVSVSPDARSQFESYQPTTVLAGRTCQAARGRRSARRWRASLASPNVHSDPVLRAR